MFKFSNAYIVPIHKNDDIIVILYFIIFSLDLFISSVLCFKNKRRGL